MIEVQGKFNEAKVFTNNVDEASIAQIIELCNQEFTKGSKIRMMPDVHAGAGCTIGTTMTIQDKVVANLVGVDIGCGMAVAKIRISKEDINFDQLDQVIRKYVPSGNEIRETPHVLSYGTGIDSLITPLNVDRAMKSIGSLGGGNHFCELNEGSDGSIYLVIHSGSRYLGKMVAEYHQKVAYSRIMDMRDAKQEIIDNLKAQGREREIHQALRGIKKPKFKKELAWLEGQDFKNYMHDMKIAQHYALSNRKAMIETIVNHMGWNVVSMFDTIHNYIDIENMILRKGAISAQKDEKVIIPMNMRDGSLIAYGKGNPDWNFSAPHGAGRIMSRSKAKQNVSLEEFQDTMKGIWTSSVGESTIDEAPMAYKPMEDIINNVGDAVDISDIIKPLYNFKAN
ncbi:RNA-splicing ligase RtcB [Bacillus cereus]|uniref:RNA-splicing ligase RtcB n=1 Tax=Bacillus cereus TaxID=1396 RepID=UPI00032E0066|nr:RNA-splicing ligase RtcB [Bacillus cereus]EOO44182.1 hypothetical protein ICK_06439 [Bacillus cereus BAG1X2-2]EOP00419.1 hypothetical protein ICO_06375 [Bacillus cereus BAG2O-1]